MDLKEAFSSWAIALSLFTVYQYIVISILYYFCIKNHSGKKAAIIYFKFSTAFLTAFYISAMMVSSFGPIYIFNFFAYITAFLSLVFLTAIRDISYKFQFVFNIATFIFTYFFNLMAIYLNQNNDNNNNNNYINLKSSASMIVPAISCALQLSFFPYCYLIHKYTNTYESVSVEENYPQEECSICLDNLSQKVVGKLKCNHYFHKECIEEHFKYNNRCPICRAENIIGRV